MAQISTNEFQAGLKVEIEGQPYVIVSAQFVKPGKGQAFVRTKLKQLRTGRVIEKTFRSGEKVDEADVVETKMRFLYRDPSGVVFMDETSYEQLTLLNEALGGIEGWLKEDLVYDVVLYKGEPISVEPPTFIDLLITETEAGAKGDTASGRVLKRATVETGREVMIPIFIEQGEVVRFDTRTGDYVSRAS